MISKSALSYPSAPQRKVFSKLSIHLHWVVGTGTMVWLWMVEVPVYMVWTPRINNKCRPVILAPDITRNHEIYNGSGEVSWIFLLSHTDGCLLPDCGYRWSPVGWEAVSSPVLNGRFVHLGSMMDCIMVNGSKSPFGAHQGPSEYKRVGMRGRGEGQWLS